MNNISFIFLMLKLTFLTSFFGCQSEPKLTKPNDPNIQYLGRVDISNRDQARFSQSGTGFRIRFEGKTCRIHLGNESATNLKNYYTLIIDNQHPEVISTSKKDSVFELQFDNISTHTVSITKRTENFVGIGLLNGIEIEKTLLPLPVSKRKMEFIGNSITCGYGNEGANANCHFTPETENNYLSYGAITARNLQAEYLAVAFSGIGIVQNYELNNHETMPIIYDRIIPQIPNLKWDFNRYSPDIVVINLGTNDFAHHNPDPALFMKTYSEFVTRIRKNYPNSHLFCIEGCMTNDSWPEKSKAMSTLQSYINQVVANMKSKGDTKIESFFFSRMQESDAGCDWHPNIKKHQQMAEELSTFIRSKTDW